MVVIPRSRWLSLSRWLTGIRIRVCVRVRGWSNWLGVHQNWTRGVHGIRMRLSKHWTDERNTVRSAWGSVRVRVTRCTLSTSSDTELML